jgi:hypothetical protein
MANATMRSSNRARMLISLPLSASTDNLYHRKADFVHGGIAG